MKAKAYFSRKVPFYVFSDGEGDDSWRFDAYPVTVDTRTLAICTHLRALAKKMDATFDDMPAPEEAAQMEAKTFEDEISKIIGGTKNGNKQTK